MKKELALVMPVYNEEECIVAVVKSWYDELSRLGIDFTMIILNDGSRDNTKGMLDTFRSYERINIINKQNSGHGPTILMGYHKAVDIADWIFQTDSDDEMKPVHFNTLWSVREKYAALFGARKGRVQPSSRKLISAVSRFTIQILFGKEVIDVNTPYRLIRSSLLKKIIDKIPDTTLTPNLIISGALNKAGVPIFNTPIPHEGRKTGTVSILKWKLWKFSIKAFFQCVRYRTTNISDK